MVGVALKLCGAFRCRTRCEERLASKLRIIPNSPLRLLCGDPHNKRTPQDRFVQNWPPAQKCWQRGQKVIKAIGYDAGPADSRRFRYEEDSQYRYWYPLVEWGHDREQCQKIITRAGLPVPMKSACFFCPASKKHEILWLQKNHPDLLQRALHIEQKAQDSLISVKGLGRSFVWNSYLSQVNDLPLFCDCHS